MRRWRRTTACERALQWTSLQLDDELDDLEQAALVRHLERCGRCSALSAEIASFTQMLRAAELVAPERPAAKGDARRRVSRGWRVGLAASLAAVVAILGAWSAEPHSSETVNSPFRFATTAQRLAYAYHEEVSAEAGDEGALAPTTSIPPQISLAVQFWS